MMNEMKNIPNSQISLNNYEFENIKLNIFDNFNYKVFRNNQYHI